LKCGGGNFSYGSAREQERAFLSMQMG
jgi:hypothetical protein